MMWQLVEVVLLLVGVVAAGPTMHAGFEPAEWTLADQLDHDASMCASYFDTALKTLQQGDNSKAIATFGAARAWAMKVLRTPDVPPDVHQLNRVKSLMILAGVYTAMLVQSFEPDSACCSLMEAYVLGAGTPSWPDVHRMLSETQLSRCNVHQPPPARLDELECKVIQIVNNTEELISTLDLQQGELFARRPEIPYAESLHDLVLKPVHVMDESHFRYATEDLDIVIRAVVPESMRASINTSVWRKRGFVDMFHSCKPTGEPPRPGTLPRLSCVWRRHPMYHSLHGGIFAGIYDPNSWDPAEQRWPGRQPNSPRWSLVPNKGRPEHLTRDAVFVAHGEDPRLFDLAPGAPFFTMQKVTAEVGVRYSATTAEQVFRNYLVDGLTGREVKLSPAADGYTSPSSFMPDGKNYSPFVRHGELHFIHTIMPLRILKCSVETGDCQWVADLEEAAKNAEIGPLRGGSAARLFDDRFLVGFGHVTLSHAQHTAFLYVVDLDNYDVKYAFMDPSSKTSPHLGYGYLDPTSWFQAGGKNYVLCTVRSAPDYISFDQSHHRSVIYEVDSALLAPFAPSVGDREAPSVVDREL